MKNISRRAETQNSEYISLFRKLKGNVNNHQQDMLLSKDTFWSFPDTYHYTFYCMMSKRHIYILYKRRYNYVQLQKLYKLVLSTSILMFQPFHGGLQLGMDADLYGK